jgi:hypothetical protein
MRILRNPRRSLPAACLMTWHLSQIRLLVSRRRCACCMDVIEQTLDLDRLISRPRANFTQS